MCFACFVMIWHFSISGAMTRINGKPGQRVGCKNHVNAALLVKRFMPALVYE